ncbi:hypothetical protein ACJJTC_018803 [Scirpophaga incertulas]
MEKLNKERKIARILFTKAKTTFENKLESKDIDEIIAAFGLLQHKADTLFSVDERIKEQSFECEDINEEQLIEDSLTTDNYRYDWERMKVKYEKILPNYGRTRKSSGSDASDVSNNNTVKSQECKNNRNHQRVVAVDRRLEAACRVHPVIIWCRAVPHDIMMADYSGAVVYDTMLANGHGAVLHTATTAWSGMVLRGVNGHGAGLHDTMMADWSGAVLLSTIPADGHGAILHGIMMPDRSDAVVRGIPVTARHRATHRSIVSPAHRGTTKDERSAARYGTSAVVQRGVILHKMFMTTARLDVCSIP